MYSALIVEDEILVRHGIKSMLDWRAVGIDRVYEASNGMEAYELYGREHPDIILTDLKMPVMDGMTLIKTIRTGDNDMRTRFIIMSCLDEFPLVQQALALNVSHYFLKITASCEAIQAELSRVIQELDEKMPHGRDEAIRRAEELLQNNKGGCTLGLNEAEAVFAALHRDPTQPYVVAIAHMTRRQNAALPNSEALRKAVAELMTPVPRLLRISAEGFALLLSTEQAKALPSLAELLRGALGADGKDLRIAVGAGGLSQSAAQLPEALRQAYRALDACYFTSSAYAAYQWAEDFSLPEDIGYRLLSLPAGFLHLPGKFIDTYGARARQIVEKRYSSPTAFEKALCAMVVWLSVETDCICDSIENMSIDCTHQIMSGQTLLEAIARFEQFATEILSLSSFSGKMPRSITSALLYIHSNLDHPLTLNEIAAHIHLNPSYLSSLFHKVMRLSLISYINSVRIERAKTLLRNTDLSVNRIASALGFVQDIYFYRLFKQVVRETPNEYRIRFQRPNSPFFGKTGDRS